MLIGVTIILFGNSINAQNRDYFIGLRGGLSIPTGQYNEQSLQDGCFAQTGFNIGIEGAWYFKPYLGLGGQFGFNLNPVDVGSLGYEKVIDDPVLLDLYIRSDPYRIITSTIGLYFRWNLSNRLSFHSKLLGGMMWAQTPYQLYKPEYFIYGPSFFEITSSRDNNLMGLIGAGIQFDISPCIAIRAEGEFQYSEMVFGFKTSTGTRYDHRTISFFNTIIALIFVL